MTWTESDIKDQSSRVALVTGANSGIGWEAARALAEHGAEVILACRSEQRGTEALEKIAGIAPSAKLSLEILDLADLSSVRAFSERLPAERIDLLINNAGVMAIPRRTTADGFEMQLGVNHLGHFALTGLLLDRLAPDARVVHVSSNAHKTGSMRWNDLMHEGFYERWMVYCQSKLANLLFSYELQRRFELHGMKRLSVGCHPGYADTNLVYRGPEEDKRPWMRPLFAAANGLVAQDARAGAAPTLMAATHPDVVGNDYIGPRGWFELRGPPVKVRSKTKARSAEDARRLWAVSAELTGVDYLQDPDAEA